MTPLFDCDIFLYEIGYSAQQKDKETKEWVAKDWDSCQALIDHKIKIICEEVEATEPPLLFMTNTPFITKLLNRRRKWDDLPPVDYVPNFRMEVAKSKEYKAGRKSEKPIHFTNIVAYVLHHYNCIVNTNGLEADDAMCIMQTSLGLDKSVICSRDKDVRQCSGWHYSWECGKQRAIGPIFIDQPGWIELQSKSTVNKSGKTITTNKLFGYGNKFFYSQMLMGDGVDNIGGAFRSGPVAAYNLLNELTSEREMYEAVAEVYQKAYKENWKKQFRENADLLWMIRELDEEGNAVRWAPPKI